jgi:MFS family permease
MTLTIDRGSGLRTLLGVAGVLLTPFVAVTDGLVVAIALPTISRDVGLGTVGAAWVVNAYTLVFASCLVVGGRLVDTIDRRYGFLGGQAAALAGSLLCGFASNGLMIDAGRGLAALGAAVATPASVSLLMSRYPDEAGRGRAFGWLSAAGGAGWASAALLGGVIVGNLGWRWIFFGVGALIVVSTVLVLLGAWPRADERSATRLDLLSSLVLAVALLVAAGSLSLLRPPLDPTRVVLVVVALALSVAAVVWLVRVRGRRPDNVLPRDMILRPVVWRAALLGLIFPLSFVVPQFAGPILHERVLGLPPERSSLLFLPLALMPVLVTGIIGRIRGKLGDRWCITGGFLVSGIGFTWAVLHSDDLWIGLIPGYSAIGIGVTAVYVGLAVLSVRGIAPAQLGTASGIFQCSNQVGGVIILAITVSLMTPAIGAGTDFGTASPAAAHLAFTVAFGAAIVLCGLAALLGVALLQHDTGGSRRQTPALPSPPP